MISGRILILESMNYTDRSTKDRLRGWGHEVVQYPCHENVVKQVGEIYPTLIILQADREHGKRLIECINALNEHGPFQSIPIAAHVPLELMDLKGSIFEAGARDCFIVPVADSELRSRIDVLLRTAYLSYKLEMMQNALEESIHRVRRQRAELDHHLTLAARIQESLIPQNLMQIPFCNFYCHFQPSGKVGGDIYNIFMLDDTHMGLYMIDVMGHGVASSMLAVALAEFLVIDVSRGTPLKRELEVWPYYEIVPPIEVVRYLNKRFSFSKYQHYFTIIYMVLNLEQGRLRYVRGAHPEPLLLRQNQKLEALNAYGTPIGFEFSQGYEEGNIQLDPGDRIFIYSDGLLELEDENRRLLDYEILSQFASSYMSDESQKEGRRPFAMQFKQLADRQGQLKDDLTLIEFMWDPPVRKNGLD